MKTKSEYAVRRLKGFAGGPPFDPVLDARTGERLWSQA